MGILFLLSISHCVIAETDYSTWISDELQDGYSIMHPPNWVGIEPLAPIDDVFLFKIQDLSEPIMAIGITDNPTKSQVVGSDLKTLLENYTKGAEITLTLEPSLMVNGIVGVGKKTDGKFAQIYLTTTAEKMIVGEVDCSNPGILNQYSSTTSIMFSSILLPFDPVIDGPTLNKKMSVTTSSPTYEVTPTPQKTYVKPTPSPVPVRTSTPVKTYAQPTPMQITASSSNAVCDCSDNIYNCKDFPLSNGVSDQKCYEYCKSIGRGDIHDLDRNNDGDACEAGW